MPPEVRARLLALHERGTVEELARLNVELGELFARAALQLLEHSGTNAQNVALIGSHGQTVCHLPQHGASLQIGEPSLIAERTGITTVADFRPRDLAAGGQGAPLVPYVDWQIMRSPDVHRVVQNIGGIANCSLLPANADLSSVRAWDTGPGVMLLDACARHFTGQACDENGVMAVRGTVNEAWLNELMAGDFFSRTPPKSAGREEFGQTFATEFLRVAESRALSPESTLATATALTTRSIADSYARFAWPHLRTFGEHEVEIILCGGGARNPTLRAMLKHELSRFNLTATLRDSDELGVPSDAKEAMSFAVLAHETALGQTNNVPFATGATRAVVLGVIVPAPRADKREELAAFAHERWANWMRYLFAHSQENTDGSVTIAASLAERWTRQMNAAYDELSTDEQESDRQEADAWRLRL